MKKKLDIPKIAKEINVGLHERYPSLVEPIKEWMVEEILKYLERK